MSKFTWSKTSKEAAPKPQSHRLRAHIAHAFILAALTPYRCAVWHSRTPLPLTASIKHSSCSVSHAEGWDVRMGFQPHLMGRLPVHSCGLFPGKVPWCPVPFAQQRLFKRKGQFTAYCPKESLRLVGVNFVLI